MILDVLRNKTARDTYNNTQTVRRYTIDLETGDTTETYLSEGPCLVDFPKVHPKKQGKEYCIYYAVEWKHNGQDYGSWALRKHNVCTGDVKWFYEPSNYLAEGVFVPDGGPNEDDGFVLSTRTNGKTGLSDF